MDKTETQFARFGADGEVFALVAEGLPAWPDDISTLTDEQLGEMHDAYVEEARGFGAEGATPDPTRVHELRERIPALRAEAARRFSDVETGGGEGGEDESGGGTEGGTEGGASSEGSEGDGGSEGDSGAGGGGEGSEDLAALTALLDETPLPAALPAIGTIAQVDPAAVAAATSQGVAQGLAAGLAPVLESLERFSTALAERPAPAVPARRVTAAELAAYRDGTAAPPASPEPRGRLVHTGDVPGIGIGQQFTDMPSLVAAFQRRHADIGVSVGSQDEKVLIATYRPDVVPESRDLRSFARSDGAGLREHIERVVGPKAIGVDPFNLGRELPIGQGGIAVEDPETVLASGGLSAPVEPYYGQLLLAEADRPVFGAIPGFIAERGGIRLVLPASIGTLTSATQPGLFTDGETDTDTSLESATANFTASDVGQPVVETDGLGIIPAGTIISSVTNSTTVVLSAATTATAANVSFSLPARNLYNLGAAVGVVTAAQDAAGPPSILKYTYDVPIGSQVEHDVYSVYTSLQFANLTARTFPEQVELNIRLANALAARVADQKALDYITGWSTLLTFAKTFGTARQLLAQFDHLAAYYRNFNRMNPMQTLRLGIPAWAINAMRGDYISTFIGGGAANWGLSDDELNAWFAERHILPFFYWDGPTDISQLFATVGSGAINTGGVNNATPVAAPDYPGTGATTSFRTKVVSFMWAEGTWLGLTTGELNLGLVRDSVLNSQNRFRNFEEVWETPAFVGLQSLRTVHTVASDGTYGAAASITLGVGSGL